MLVGIEVGGRGGKGKRQGEIREGERGMQRVVGLEEQARKWFTILVGQLFIDDAKGFRSL